MLDRLQQRLAETYQADPGYDVRDFLITDARVARAISGDNVLTAGGETLLVHEDEDGLSMSLYLEAGLLERLESDDPLTTLREDQLEDFCKVIEGLSHFNYVAWRASRDRSMSLLELELQAEVDKFVSTMQLALDQQDNELLNGLYARLFNKITLRPDLDDEQVERYRAATEFAARFCRGLRKRMLHKGDVDLPDLRRFYRLSLTDKISQIHSHAWTID
jgi:hypothetical protein